MRSKTFLAGNIIASIYSVVLSWMLIGLTIIDNGGQSIINTLGRFFENAFQLIDMDLSIVNYLYVLAISMLLHISLFVLGCIISWISYITKNDTLATVVAVIYLIGTICSPICLFFGIVISAIAFIGANNQKKLNKTTEK
ncbi:MAG: hypothetical protein IKU24_03745 [Clostridia bacterium]|nr:hypothetical protein [Clostridia bacterium]